MLSVMKLLVAGGVDPTWYVEDTYTPLIKACRLGHADIVEYLVSLPTVRAEIDATSLHGMPSLSWAADAGHEPIVHLLLDAGDDTTIIENVALCAAKIASMLRRASRRTRR